MELPARHGAALLLTLGLTVVAARPSPESGTEAPPAGVAVGAVEGTVHLEGVETPPPMLSPYARRRYRPPAPAGSGAGAVENVVVWVEAVDARAGDPGEAAIVQRDLTIIPHVTPIRVGTRIRFPNEDEVFHNLFSLSDPHPFNLGRYPPGETRTQVFSREGVVRVFCDIHSDMEAVILVLDTPWFTKPDRSGRYRIEGVPDGTHRVVAWHESAGADTVEVTVGAAGPSTADFRLGRRP